MISELTTERLIMRPFKEKEAHLIFELDSNPKVMEHLGIATMKNIEEGAKVIESLIAQYKDHGIGRYVVELKETGEFIGWAGLKYMPELINDHQNHYDLGYRFSSKHWGRGYATEASKAWLEYADGIGQMSPIHAYTAEGHVASQQVLLKCGFELAGRFHDGLGWCTWLNRRSQNH